MRAWHRLNRSGLIWFYELEGIMGILNIDQDIISMKFTPSKAISVFMCNNTFVMIIFKSS